jgi:hypothetical protein
MCEFVGLQTDCLYMLAVAWSLTSAHEIEIETSLSNYAAFGQ